MLKPVVLACVISLSAAGPLHGQKVARLTEDLRLDATKEDFPSVGAVAIGPRGQIAVGIPKDNEIRLYDSVGKKLGSFGRKGSGPGEFRSIGLIGWIGDTIFVSDESQRRISFFGPDVKLLRTMPTPVGKVDGAMAPAGNTTAVHYYAVALYGDGSMLARGSIAYPTGSDQPWRTFVGFVSPTGEIRPLAAAPNFDDPKRMMSYAGFEHDVPFTARPQMTVATDGARYGFVTENSGSGGTVDIAIYKRDGTVDYMKKLAFKGVPIPGKVRDSALAAFIPKPGRPTEGPSDLGLHFQTVARGLMPAFYPTVESTLPMVDATLWVLGPVRNDQWTATVLDGRGNVLGTVSPPFKTRIRYGTATQIWTTQRDADDLISIVRYRITW